MLMSKMEKFQYIIKLLQIIQKKFINFLKQNKIEARPGYRNLDRAKIYCKSMKVFKNNKLNSKYFENIVVLPSRPDQKISDIKKIANLINKY